MGGAGGKQPVKRLDDDDLSASLSNNTWVHALFTTTIFIALHSASTVFDYVRKRSKKKKTAKKKCTTYKNL